MPTATMAAPTKAESMIVGGWTSFDFSLTRTALRVFGEAFKGFVGVDYTPLASATQVVAGTNWCFLAKGTVVVPSAPELAALIYIFEPLEGHAYITEIKQIKPGM